MNVRFYIGLLIFAGALLADCVDGSRDTTPAEQSYQAEAMVALRASLPSAPTGWKLEDRGVFAPAKSVCKGSDASRVAYSVAYLWMDGIAEQNKRSEEMSRKIGALRTIPADKLTEMNEYARQGRALQREVPKARAAGNQAEVERLNAEIKSLTAKAYAIKQAHEESIRPQVMAISEEFAKAEEGKSYQVKLSLATNDYAEPGVKPGAGMVRKGDSSVIVFGQAAPKGKKPMTTDTVTARFRGDAAQVETISRGWEPKAAMATMPGGAGRSEAGR